MVSVDFDPRVYSRLDSDVLEGYCTLASLLEPSSGDGTPQRWMQAQRRQTEGLFVEAHSLIVVLLLVHHSLFEEMSVVPHNLFGELFEGPHSLFGVLSGESHSLFEELSGESHSLFEGLFSGV